MSTFAFAALAPVAGVALGILGGIAYELSPAHKRTREHIARMEHQTNARWARVIAEIRAESQAT